MIHFLRQRHRRIFIALGLFLPVALAVGIAVRKPIPVMDATPGGLGNGLAQSGVILWERPGLFPKSPVETRLARDAGGDNLTVSFTGAKDFIEPDLLVYGVPGNFADTNSLPDNAVLLGKFTAPTLPIPDSLTGTNSVLILYSLADNEIVDCSQPIRLGDSTK